MRLATLLLTGIAALLSTTLAAPSTALYIKVVDSSTGSPLQDASCVLQTADTLKTVASTRSNIIGLCEFPDVRSKGYYELSVSKTDFFNLNTKLLNSNSNSFPSSAPYQVQLSKQGNKDKFRVVLSWGDTVSDLDSYMFDPQECSVSYQNFECGSVNTGKIQLDVDDTTYYGPETITLTGATEGIFAYFVNIYSIGKCFDEGIKANVQIWSDRDGGLLLDLDNPLENPEPKCSNEPAKPKTCKQYWHVANYNANSRKWEVVNEFVKTGGFVSPDQSETKLPSSDCSCRGVTGNLNANLVNQDANALSVGTVNILEKPLCASHLQGLYDASTTTDHSISSTEFLNVIHQRTEDRLTNRLELVKLYKDRLVNSMTILNRDALDTTNSAACCTPCDECVFDINFGLEVNRKGSCVRYAPNQNFNDLKDQANFRDVLIEMNTWNKDRQDDASLKWVFAGDKDGNMFVAPKLDTGKSSCNTFDARLRPWYSEAVCGPKRVLIVLDASAGITEGQFAESKQGVSSILGSVSSRDRVNILVVTAEGTKTMGDEATGDVLDGFAYQSCLGSGMLAGTSQNVKLMLRFVEQLSLSQVPGNPDFGVAIQEALNMMDADGTESIDKYKDAIIVLAGSPGWSDVPVSADLFMYAYGNGAISDNCASWAGSTVSYCNSGQDMSLTPGLYYLQLDSWHRNKDGDVRLSALYFDSLGLGMVTTAAAPIYVNGELMGVMGADVPVSEIVVDMNAVATGAGSGKKETAAQETLARTPTSYAFVVDASGVVMWHPLLKLPADLTKEPHAVNIQSLETAPDFNTKVWTALQANFASGIFPLTNSVSITGEYVTARGDSTYSGYDLETRSFTYSWDRLAGTDFAVVVALSDEDRTDKDLLFPVSIDWSTSGKPVFHRVDLYEGSELGGTLQEVALHGSSKVLATNSAVFISAKSTSKPYEWLNVAPSKPIISTFKSAVKASTQGNNALKLLSDIELSVAAHSDIRVSQRMNECWLNADKASYNSQNPFATWAWRYVATPAGVLRMLPGFPWQHAYDPTTRPWYLAAANNFNADEGKYLYTFSTPYIDGGGAGEVIALSKGIRGLSSQSGKRDLLAVVALDMTVKVFEEFLFDAVPACKQTATRTCILINENGFVVYHKDFVIGEAQDAKEHVFLAEKHASVATWLVNQGVLKPSRCADFDDTAVKSTYKVDTTSASLGTKVVLQECGSFVMSAVPDTNLFLIEVDGSGCGFANIFACLPCNRENCANTVLRPGNDALLCQPCACQLAFSSCNGTFALGSDGGDSDEPPVCPVSPTAQLGYLGLCDPLLINSTPSILNNGSTTSYLLYIGVAVAFIVGSCFLLYRRNRNYLRSVRQEFSNALAAAGSGAAGGGVSVPSNPTSSININAGLNSSINSTPNPGYSVQQQQSGYSGQQQKPEYSGQQQAEYSGEYSVQQQQSQQAPLYPGVNSNASVDDEDMPVALAVDGGNEVQKMDSSFCTACGTKQQGHEAFCTSCGTRK